MKKKRLGILCLGGLGLLAGAAARAETAPATSGSVEWQRLPDLPEALGLGGPFAGVSGGALIAAGGANFPRGMPWEGGPKVWSDHIYALPQTDGAWKTCATKLPRPLAYGVSLTTDEEVLCLGGGDAREHYADAFALRWVNGEVSFSSLPPLPRPAAFACGALLGRTVYVAGGQETPNATNALKTFWALDLNQAPPLRRWQELEPWPGPARILAVAGVQDGSFFLVSGADLVPDPATGQPQRIYLSDAYRYTPRKGWRAIAPVPRPVVAAPSPAAPFGQSHLVIFGGDDGSYGADPSRSPAGGTGSALADHPGFSRAVLAYHTITDTWRVIGQTPAPRVTTPLVPWAGGFAVPSGEVRPGVRSPQIDLARPTTSRVNFGWANYMTLIVYLGSMVVLGGWFSRRNKTTDDFFRGGQRVPWWAAGISIYATMLSSISFMATPAKAYATNWNYYLMVIAIVLVQPVVVLFYLPVFRQLNVTSAYEYLEKRFNLAVRWFGCVSFILLQVGRMSIVLYLPALALATVSNVDIYTCIVLTGVLCVIYTMLGGIEAVVWTDVAQAVILLAGVIGSLALILFQSEGGLPAFFGSAHGHAKFLENLDWSWDLTAATVWVVLVGNLFSNLVPYTASQDVVQRYITTKDARQAARSIWTNAAMVMPSTALFFLMGTALFVFYRNHPERLDPMMPTDAIFPLFIVRELPTALAGLVVAGIFAAAQSTLASSLNSVATCCIIDFYQRLRPGIADQAKLRMARWITLWLGLGVTAVACGLARLNIGSLWDAFIGILNLTGSALAGLFALGLFTRRANGIGALTGAVVSVAVLFYVQQHTRLHFFLYAAVGIAVCFFVGWLASCCVRREPEDLHGLTIYTRDRGRPDTSQSNERVGPLP
jgi:SSS family transporter